MNGTREPLWAPADVARYLQIPVSTLYMWRAKGYGPRSSKVGRHVRYRREDVEQWMVEQVDS